METIKIAVMDYNTVTITMYEARIPSDNDSVEDFIIEQGHSLSECSWMFTENDIEIIY